MQKNMADASTPSLRSGTPYSSMTHESSSSRILAATSWSQVAEEDLVTHLGQRERTRQEVLFEIISSEERYVNELIRMKDFWIDPLLHPYALSASAQPSPSPNLDYDFFTRTDSPSPLGASSQSTDYLPPIAARFMSPTPPPAHHAPSTHVDSEMAPLDTDEEDEYDDTVGRPYADSRRVQNVQNMSQASKHAHPRSPYRAGATPPSGSNKKTVPFPSRSHHSLPPPPRQMPQSESTHSLGRQSADADRDRRERNHSQGHPSPSDRRTMASSGAKTTGTTGSAVLRKFKKSQTGRDEDVFGGAIPPHMIPEDLRICLEVIDSGVFDGHKRLHDALKKRYDEQYPLVRSLADVFVANSDLFSGYAKYVLHLERALEQINTLLIADTTKKPPKSKSSSPPTSSNTPAATSPADFVRVCKFVQALERSAPARGESGLAISLSKPFQRLLKYPLLFQNLLYHTDPSTFEYESTLQMVAEVESIVRSIEDEKIQKEDRDKTRDVWARIEGLDKVRQLALPKPSRVLVEERVCFPVAGSGSKGSGSSGSSSAPPMINGKNVRGKSSFKRLSDVLGTGNGGFGGKKDLWLVVFNDVVLQCQRTGTTSLPISAATNSRTNSLPDLQGKAKYATAGKRSMQTKPRNLYKFIKIETWAIGDLVQARDGAVSKEDVARSRMHVHQPRIVPLPDDDENSDGGAMDSDDSDRKSKMSFSYWGADKITVQKPVVKARPGAAAPRRGGSGAPSYGRESSANAKFGSRLVSGDGLPTHGGGGARPASRRTGAVPSTRTRHATEESGTRATVTREKPAWGSSSATTGRSTGATAMSSGQRARNMSQTSGAPTKNGTSAAAASSGATLKSVASPSEDSGVGLYRQMLAKDPSLQRSG